MNVGVLVLLSLSITIIIYFLVRLILNYKRGGFLYKSALKTIKSFSFSMVLLLLFYGFSFGYSFGSLTANETYRQELLGQNLEGNAHSFLFTNDSLGKGIYDYNMEEGETESAYLTEEYWNLIFGTADDPESGIVDYVAYDHFYTWDDFSRLILPDGYLADFEDPTYSTIYEPIYGESYGITPFAYYQYNPEYYLQYSVWDKLYEEFNDEFEFYYRSTLVSNFIGRTIEQSELKDYRSYDMVSLQDYNPETNTYYSSFDDLYKENTFNSKVEVSERVKGDTNYEDDTYVIGEYTFSNIAEGYEYDDLLAINNHYYDENGNLAPFESVGAELENFNSLNIEIAISELFYEANPNIVLGESYDFALNDGARLVKFTPIATFSDIYSSTNDQFFGSFLINYLDFNILKYNFRDTTSQMSSSSPILLQTENLLDENSIRMHTSEKYLKELNKESTLKEYLHEWNNTISNSIFGADLNELNEKQRDVVHSFTIHVNFNSTQDGASTLFYGKNLDGYSTFLIVNIFNMIMLILIFFVVIFIIYSVIGKKIKEQFKQFGILKSMGYKTNNISISFVLFPILILFLANILALVLMTPFYLFQLNNLQSRFFVSISSFAFPTLITWLVISIGILLFFSYLKIWRTLRRSELYLLSGSKRFTPGLLFRGASKISTRFKSFETSYAFKNIFKSIPKSSIVFTSVLFSLVIVGLSLMISSFVKVNIDDNFSAVNFNDYYYIQHSSKFDYGDSNGLYRSLATDYRSYQEYNTSNLNDAIKEAYTLGDYEFASEALLTYDPSLGFDVNFTNATNLIIDYFITNPIIERNDLAVEEVTNRFDLFEYSYISSASMKEYFELESKLFKDFKMSNPLQDLKDFMNLPFLYDAQEYPFITFGNLNNYYINNAISLFKKFLATDGFEYINQRYPDLEISDLDIDDLFTLFSDLSEEGMKVYDDFFPSIYFGRTLYDKDTTSLFSYHNTGRFSEDEDTSYDNSQKLVSTIFEDLEQINIFFNFETKKGETISSLLEKEIPNKNQNYIPVAIDEGTSKMLDVKKGDYFYAKLDENSVFYEIEGLESIPLKVVGVYEKHDYGIITSQEFITNRFNGITRIYNALVTFDSDAFDKTISSTFSLNTYEEAILNDWNIYILQEEDYNEVPHIPDPTNTSFRYMLEPNYLHYSIPLLYEFSSRVYKEVTIAILLSIIFILIIPIFIILISIKEVIDDNIVEVSMLKSLGYNTWQTSRLILSSSLVIVGFSFLILLPIMFTFGFIFNTLFISLFALDLTFKLLWWNWLVLLGLLFLILGILYSVSYYFYYKLKSKDVILNISK